MHKICFTVSLFHASTFFEHHVLIVRRSKLCYTASGIITPIGSRPVRREDWLNQSSLNLCHILGDSDIHSDCHESLKSHGLCSLAQSTLISPRAKLDALLLSQSALPSSYWPEINNFLK